MLNSELNFPLGVHDSVGRVQQHFLHIGQTLDLLLQLVIAGVDSFKETLSHAAGLYDDVPQLVGGAENVLLGGLDGSPQAHLASHIILIRQNGLNTLQHRLGVVAHTVDSLPGVVDVGGEEADDVVRLLSQGLQDGSSAPSASSGESLDLVVHPQQESGNVVDLLLDPTGAGDGLETFGHLVNLLFDLKAFLLGLLIVVPHNFQHLEEGISDVKVPTGRENEKTKTETNWNKEGKFRGCLA